MELITCKDDKEFIDLLLPHNQRWSKSNKKYIFRGQGGDYDQITPSAHRIKNIRIIKKLSAKHSNREHFGMEYEILSDFIKICNKRGLLIPNYYNLKRDEDFPDFLEMLNRIERNEINWPNDNYLPIISLAQHYGLPTCCIDWTRNPLKAAFFAAISDKTNHDVSVYALDTTNIFYRDLEKEEKNTYRQKSRIQYRVFTSHYYENNFIRAQEGLFLVCTHYGLKANDVFQPNNLIDYCDHEKIELIKISLDSKYSKNVIQLLQKYDINYSSIFPDLNGVVHYMKTNKDYIEYV